jgi:transposase-like protein
VGNSNFSEDFKRDAVAQITERGYPVAEVSKRLGVSPHSLYAWKKKFSKSSVLGESDQATEIRRLKQELARVTEEREFLEKATAYFAKDAKMRYAFVGEHRPLFSVRAMCRCLRIHPSGFYA